jgi:hypothetical protein
MRNARDSILLLTAVLLSLAIVSQAGCAAVRGRRSAPEQSGFLGDYSQLEPREGYEVHDVYINPKAVWISYDSVQIDSVTLWVNEETQSLEDEERQMLTDLLFKALNDQSASIKSVPGIAGKDLGVGGTVNPDARVVLEARGWKVEEKGVWPALRNQESKR